MGIFLKTLGDNTKPAMFLVHGMMGSSKDWEYILDGLLTKYYCIVIDLPGHGSSSVGSYNNFKELIDSISKLLINYKRPMSVLGHSLGGRVALQLILNYPHLFDQSFLISCNPGIQDDKLKQQRYTLDCQLFEKINGGDETLPIFFDRWYSNPIFGDLKNSAHYNEFLSFRQDHDYRKWQQAIKFLSIGSQDNLWPQVHKLQIPCTYFCGDQDEKYGQIGREFEKLSNKIKLKPILNCGHNIHMQCPDKLLERILLS